MGLFDIFKSSKERKTFGTLHGMDLREWNDGYKSDEKSIQLTVICPLHVLENNNKKKITYGII